MENELLLNILLLEKEKQSLDKHIAEVKVKSEQLKASCNNHIPVYLGSYKDEHCTLFNKSCCILCGYGLDIEDPLFYYKKHSFNGIDYGTWGNKIIDAEEYLSHLDISNSLQCEEKISLIKSIAFEIIAKNPEISPDELFCELDKSIKVLIAKEKNKSNNKSHM